MKRDYWDISPIPSFLRAVCLLAPGAQKPPRPDANLLLWGLELSGTQNYHPSRLQSPFLHSWECKLVMGAAVHWCSLLEIISMLDCYFSLCKVPSSVFSSNQKLNRDILPIFAQIKPSFVSLTSLTRNLSLWLDWSAQCRCLSADSSSCRVVSDSAASQDSAANTNTMRHFTVSVR